MSGDDHDQFNDYNDSQGIFSPGLGQVGDGLKCFDDIRHKLSPDGLLVEMACRPSTAGAGCGKTRQLLVGWPELIAIKCDVSPHDAFRGIPQLAEWASPWRLANGQEGVFWVPEGARCGDCGNLLQPLFSSEECARYILQMRKKGWLNQQDEQSVGQQAARVAAALRR
jgi:hypothetical protein